MERLKIKWKLGILATLSAVAFLLLMVSNYSVINSLSVLNHISLKTAQIETQMLMLRRHEKDFIARKDIKYLDKFDSTFSKISDDLIELQNYLNLAKIKIDKVKPLSDVLNQYQNLFQQLATQQKLIGLNSKDGLYGSLRADVHQLESMITQYESNNLTNLTTNALMRSMLMLRRHEKDFMLRKDLKYFSKFQNKVTLLKTEVSNSGFTNNFNNNALEAINSYESKFSQLVQAEQKFGLNSKLGLLGEMRSIIHQSEEQLTSLHHLVSDQTQSFIKKEKLFNILLGLLLILISIALFTYIATGISTRIQKLSRIMSSAALTQDLSVRANLSGNDEITTMASVYNKMMEEFDSLMNEVKHSSLELAAASKGLRQTTIDTNHGVNRQLLNSEQAVTAMNQVTNSVSEVAANASGAAQASTSADQASTIGHNLVKDNQKSFTKLAHEIEKTSVIIENLSKESNNIGGMLNNIRGIADQTNLLALNAAIEAARAGEQGRGFAVVADEVRTLAKDSADSTQEIENVINCLQSLATEAVDAMLQGKNQIKESIENSLNVENALNDIKNSSEIVNTMNLHIATAAEEQSVVANEVNQNIISIANVAKDTSQLTETISVSSQQLQILSDQLGDRVLKFKLTS